MSTDRLLDAGAVLPGDGPADPAVTRMTGRDYHHPALPGRTVVRLVSEPVGAAEDLSMEFLGFTTGHAGPVGHARTRTLGFPQWVLAHDPAHAREALALVKEMEKLARLAKSKPGNARDGYEDIAARLGGTVPHFLPAFWEQAGRAYVEAENLRQAAQCFTAARRAEQVHGLAVDEARQRDVHLEFALAGALSAKALTEYARDVLGRRPAPEAYALVRDVAVHRVAGGLAPPQGLAAELRRLAKAAGLDGAAEDESLVGELLMLPAVTRAHDSFWKAYRPALQRLARRDPAVTARLLAVVPDPPDAGPQVLDQWLELLEGAGATEAMARGDADAAAWLERLAQHRAARRLQRRRPCPRLDALVERLASRLRAADRPLRLHTAHGETDLNLMDRCLSLGVPVADHDGWADGLPVSAWIDAEPAGRRDLSAIAADPVLLPALTRGLWRHLDQYQYLHAKYRLAGGRMLEVLALPGVRAALRAGIAQVTARVDGTTLAGLELVVKALGPLWTEAGAALAPADLRRVAAADVAAALARTLRSGLVDELGWPAYQSAVAGLKRISTADSWPEAVLTDGVRVVAVPPTGDPVTHVVRIPPDTPWQNANIGAQWIDGRLLVTADGYQGRWGYWADLPDECFDRRGGERVWTDGPVPHLPLPGGGVTTGARPWQAGDAQEPRRFPVSSDGAGYWRCEPDSRGGSAAWRWREYDPATGDGGRPGGPAFFTDDAPGGGRLVAEWSWLRPAPPVYADSPLGSADGLLGWRLHVLDDGTQVGRSVDGRTVRLAGLMPGEHLVGALTLPGDDRPRPVTVKDATWTRSSNVTVTVWDPDGAGPVQECAASHSRPPFVHWHALRPRDERASAALRAVTPALATALLADVTNGGGDLDSLVEQAVTRRLPELTHPDLRRAVRGEVRTALHLAGRLAELARLVAAAAPNATAQPVSPAAPDAARPAAAPEVSDAELARALDPLVQWRTRYYDGTADVRAAVLGQLTAITAALADPPRPGVRLPNAESPWPQLLPGLGAVLMVAAGTTASDPRRLAVTRLLRAFADSPFAAADPRVRVVDLAVDENYRWADEVHADGRRLVFLSGQRHRIDTGGRVEASLRYAVDRCPEAAFAPIEGIQVRREFRRGGWGDAARLRTACDRLDRDGAPPWRPEAAARLAELTGLTRPEAVLLLAGLPIGDADEPALTAPQRKLLGVSAAAARLARTRWRDVAHEHRVALLDAAVPDDPARLWTDGPDVDAVAARWTALFGRRTPIGADLLVEAARIVPGRDGAEVVQALLDPQADGWLCTDGVTEAHYWQLSTSSPHGEPFSEKRLPAAAAALAWLAYRLPAGDPLRAALPRALELLGQRLDNPKLALGTVFHRHALVPDGMAGLWCSNAHEGGYGTYHLLPRDITTPDAPALALGPVELSTALRLLRDPALAAAVTQGGSLPAGAWPHDPRHTVPDLVEEVAAAYGLAPEAAAYHLQLLALPDPTDTNVARWLGLTAAGLKPLRAALLAAGLVVEARRARAGRGVFLPGGWLDLKAPALPLESWKAEPLGLRPGAAPPLGAVLVGRPVADLFRTAWTRIQAGDTPGYRSPTG